MSFRYSTSHYSQRGKAKEITTLILQINYSLLKMNQNLKSELQAKKYEIISNYKQKYDQTKIKIEQIARQNEIKRKNILDEASNFQNTVEKVKLKVCELMKNLLESVTEDKKCNEAVNIKDLSDYLKIQKQLLKKITSQKQQSPITEINLHQLLTKSRFEQILRKIKKTQLQEEIKFLQGNVISKGNIIYNPGNSILVSSSQEKELNAKLENALTELERVIRLSIPCATNKDSSDKLGILEKQQGRLKQAQNFLSQQYTSIGKIIDFLQKQMQNISERLPIIPSNLPRRIDDAEEQTSFVEQTIDQYELNSLLDRKSTERLIIAMRHPFEQVEEGINELKRKIKAIEKKM